MCNNNFNDINNIKFCIIGLGLIGGSLAKAFRQRLDATDIIAVDVDKKAINLALKEGVVQGGFTELNKYVFESDIIFICTPVDIIPKYIKALQNNIKQECIITDVGSTKSKIINYINSLPNPPCFIGGHPMTGTEQAGYEASYPHLFENAYYVLTPTKKSNDQSMNIMMKLIRGIGGIPIIIDAETHDRATAGISHVPHIIASSLVNLIKEIDTHDGKMQMLAAGGFKDITRIASSNPEMWQDIVFSNKEQIEDILDKYINNLTTLLRHIKNDHINEVYDFFVSARDFRNKFSDEKKGLIAPIFQLEIDTVDKPGIIGEITTLLGKHNINIKNINISHSREFEQGCMIITFKDNESLNKAFNLLNSAGHKVYKPI